MRKYKHRYESVSDQIGKCVAMVIAGIFFFGLAAVTCYMNHSFIPGAVFMLICLVLWCTAVISATVSNVKHTLKRQRQAQENAENNPQHKSDYFDGSGQVRRIRPRRRVLSKNALKNNIKMISITLCISSIFMVPSIISGNGRIPRFFAVAWMALLGIALVNYILRLRTYDRYELHDVEDYERYDDTESHLTNNEQQISKTTCPYCGKEVLSTYLFCDGCDQELP